MGNLNYKRITYALFIYAVPATIPIQLYVAEYTYPSVPTLLFHMFIKVFIKCGFYKLFSCLLFFMHNMHTVTKFDILNYVPNVYSKVEILGMYKSKHSCVVLECVCGWYFQTSIQNWYSWTGYHCNILPSHACHPSHAENVTEWDE